MTEALLKVSEQFIQDHGTYQREDVFRIIVATRSDD